MINDNPTEINEKLKKRDRNQDLRDGDDDEYIFCLKTESEPNVAITSNNSSENSIQKATQNDSNTLMINKEILNMEMNEVNIEKQSEKLSILFEKSNQLGEGITEHMQSAILFNKLPPSFTGKVRRLEEKGNTQWKQKKTKNHQRNQGKKKN